MARLVAIPAVVGTIAVGVWVAGAAITNDFRASMALTAVWFGVTGLACVVIARRSRALRVPVLASYVATVAVIGGYLGLTTVRERVVDERVLQGAEVLSGGFRSEEHDTSGVARVVRGDGGRHVLTLTSFETSPGPDLRVRLVPGDTANGAAKGAVDLGALKGNRGDQQYSLPHDAGLEGHTVVIWCRTFSAPFGRARLG
jgi:Electron transfer DM13